MAKTIVDELAGGHHLTRAELGRVIGATGEALAYFVMYAELEYLVCSGPTRGAQHTYALVSERIRSERVGSIAELARRFFVGHGPASVADLRRWASLTQTQAASATEAAALHLQRVVVDGVELWFDPEAPDPAATGRAALLPLYDEALLSYPQLNFPRAPGHPHVPGADLFVGSVVVDATNVGTWRRTIAGRRLVAGARPRPGAHQRPAIGHRRRRP